MKLAGASVYVLASLAVAFAPSVSAQTTNGPPVAPLVETILDAMDRDDNAAALKLARAELKLCEAQARAPVCLNLISVIGRLLTATGLPAEGEAYARRALAEAEHFFGQDAVVTAQALTNLQISLFQQQRYAEAETIGARASAAWESAAGIGDARTISSIRMQASLLRLLMRREDEESLLRAAVQRALAARIPAYSLAGIRAAFGGTLLVGDKIDAAQAELYEAIRLFDLAGESKDADALDSLLRLAHSFLERDEPEKAIGLITAALNLSEGRSEAAWVHWKALKMSIDAYKAAGMLDAANTALDRAILFGERNPAIEGPLPMGRVTFLIWRGRVKEAERALKRTLAGAEFRELRLQQKQMLRIMLVILLGIQSKWDEAERTLAAIEPEAMKRMQLIDGLDVQLHRLKAYLALARDQPAVARVEFRRAGIALARRSQGADAGLRRELQAYRDLFDGQIKTSWWLANGYRKDEPRALAKDWFEWVATW